MSNYNLIRNIEDNIMMIDGISTTIVSESSKPAVRNSISYSRMEWKKAVQLHSNAVLRLKERPKDNNLRKNMMMLRKKKEATREKYVAIRNQGLSPRQPKVKSRVQSVKNRRASQSTTVPASTMVRQEPPVVDNTIKSKPSIVSRSIGGIKSAVSKYNIPNPVRPFHNYVLQNFHR